MCIDVLISKLAAIKINLTIQEFDETLQLDEEKNNDYQNCLVEEINELIEEHQMEIKNNTPSCSSSTLSSTEDLSIANNQESASTTDKRSLECGREIFFSNSLEIMDNLSTSQVEEAAGPHITELKTSFESFQRSLKRAMAHNNTTRLANKVQLTLPDMFQNK